MEEKPQFSDIDGVSPYAATCIYCGLNVHQEYMVSKLCRNCRRLFLLFQFSKTFGKLLAPALALGVLLFFLDETRSIAIWIPIIALLPNILIGAFQKTVIFLGVPNEQKILPMIRYSKKLKDATYIDKALELWSTSVEDLSEPLRLKILSEFVDSIVLNIKPNPPGLFVKLSKSISMEMGEFVSLLMDHTNLRDAFKQVPGTGTIPDIWEHATDHIKTQILGILSEDLGKEPYANDEEKKLLLEDLFLIDEDLRGFIGANKKWLIILEELDAFEPEEPPKNVFAEARRTAEAQAKLQQLNG